MLLLLSHRKHGKNHHPSFLFLWVAENPQMSECTNCGTLWATMEGRCFVCNGEKKRKTIASEEVHVDTPAQLLKSYMNSVRHQAQDMLIKHKSEIVRNYKCNHFTKIVFDLVSDVDDIAEVLKSSGWHVTVERDSCESHCTNPACDLCEKFLFITSPRIVPEPKN